MKQTETNGSQEEGEGRTLSLFNELDPLVFWVLSRSVVLWATTSGRSAVYHSPSGNYFSVRMADWNYQRAGGKSSRPNSPANTNVIQREIYSHFCLLRGSNSCCHTEKRFRPLFTLAAQVTLLMEVAVTTRQLRCFYFSRCGGSSPRPPIGQYPSPLLRWKLPKLEDRPELSER